jgi:hypothetical protein
VLFARFHGTLVDFRPERNIVSYVFTELIDSGQASILAAVVKFEWELEAFGGLAELVNCVRLKSGRFGFDSQSPHTHNASQPAFKYDKQDASLAQLVDAFHLNWKGSGFESRVKHMEILY